MASCSQTPSSRATAEPNPGQGFARPTAAGQVGSGVPPFWVRPGYRVTEAAPALEEARFLEVDSKGNLYVSQPGRGAIVRLRPEGERFIDPKVFVSGRPTVQGMQWADGWLWFTQSGAVFKARDKDGDGTAEDVVQVLADLPSGGAHWMRSILVTGTYLYTSIGDSGNATDQRTTDRQKIWRYNLDGSGKKLFASGIRNTEKLRLRPGTQEIWGADHGSDWFGRTIGDREGKQPITDYNPPDEVNKYVQDGFYGHPFVTGMRAPRPEFYDRPDIIDLAAKTIVPEWPIYAHWAPNGFAFYDGELMKELKGDMFVACHGSWNRSTKVGYCILRITFDQVTGKPYGAMVLVSTLADQRVLARPVDCVQTKDGALLFSSDQPTPAIYRIAPAK